MKTPDELTQLLAPELRAMGEAHGAMGARLFELFEDGTLTVEEALVATALCGAFLDMLMDDPVAVGTVLMGKVLHNEEQARAFAAQLADMPEAA